jgi:WD40 repeat protein
VPLCTFQAHGKTTSGISFSSGVPGLMATSSIDKTVKLWDVANIQRVDPGPFSGGRAGSTGVAAQGLEPHCVMYKSMNVGKLFALQYYTDDPYVLATAGDKGSVAVWECDEAETVKNYFQDRTVKSGDGVYIDLLNAPGAAKTSASAAKVTEQSLNSVSAALALPGHKVTIQPMIQDDSWMDEPEPVTTKIEKKTKKVKSKDKDKAKKEKK